MKYLNVLELVYLVIQCLSIQIQCYFENAYNMIFPLLRCFTTLKSKCPKGRFVAMRFISFVVCFIILSSMYSIGMTVHS